MPNATKVQQFGNQLAVLFDDGSKQLAYPTPGGLWMITNTVGPVGGTGSTPPPAGAYSVIFPCAEHRVSDSFAVHVARGSVNPGTDYIASYGSEFWSVANGTVTDIDTSNDGSGGRMVHVDHTDGTGADYLHLSQIDVSVGAVVTQGQHLGLTGASGFDSDHGYGAHLHISYRTTTGHAYMNYDNIDFDALVRSLGLT